MKKIVVVGGGAGGLELATRLGNKLGKKGKAQITLIDRSRTHIWKPLLHEVATGSLNSETDGVVYRAHSSRHHYQFQIGSMEGMNFPEKKIILSPVLDDDGQEILPSREIEYDTLVMAVGSVSNDFGTPGVSDYSFFLDSHLQARRFHQALLNQFLKLSQQEGDPTLSLSIVGAGATGVELAAELYHVANLMKMYGMPNISAKNLKITLIEAGQRILPALPERIALSAHQELQKLGVIIQVNTRITEARSDGYIDADGQLIPSDLRVWAAGVKAPEFIPEMKVFETNRAGQILVKPTLQSTVTDDVYVIGDCCACEQPDGSWVPPRAQSAHQMASLVYKNILAKDVGKDLQKYVYKDHGSLVNLSKYSTVGSLMGNLTQGSMFIEGRVARFVYISLYRMHQIAIHGWLGAMAVMLAQKIGNSVKPKMKLH